MSTVAHLYAEARALALATPGYLQLGTMPADLPFAPERPYVLPIVEHLSGLIEGATEKTRPVLDALLAAAGDLLWRHTYTQAQVGSYHLRNYAWCNIASPDGPFLSDAFRLSIGVWNHGVFYPPHRHEPEETYLVLSGSAIFFSEGEVERRAVAGDTVHHRPDQLHAMDMDEAPLIAMAYWSGANLTRPSRIGADA